MLYVVLAAAIVACGNERPHAPAQNRTSAPGDRSPTAPENAPTATLPTSPWPDAPEELRTELATAETPEQCKKRLQTSMSATIAEGVEQLGYEGFVDDLCGSLAALREHSIERCNALSVSSARRNCARRLAIADAKPDLCPTDLTAPGREPICLAWAERNRDLCRGAEPKDVVRCKAVLDGKLESCTNPDERNPSLCRAEVRRYGSIFGSERERAEFTSTTQTHFALHAVTQSHPSREVDFTRTTLERGVVLYHCTGRDFIALGEATRLPLENVAMLLEAPVVELAFAAPSHSEAPFTISTALVESWLGIASPHEPIATSEEEPSGEIKITKWPSKRGDLLIGQITGYVRGHGERAQVTGDFQTYLRDVVDGGEVCTTPLSRVR